MNCITLLPSSKSLIDNSSCGCTNQLLNSTKYSALLISFKMDPYFNENKTLSQFFLIFRNSNNHLISFCGLTLKISLHRINGTVKTVNINNPEVNKQGCYISINCTNAFNEDDFNGVESISCLLRSNNFTNSDYCALLNMGVVCRLGFDEIEAEPLPVNILEGQSIADMTKSLKCLVGENVSITTLDSNIDEYNGKLECITCPYYVTLNNTNNNTCEIIPINKITCVTSPKACCIDLTCLLQTTNLKDSCFIDKLNSLKGKDIEIQCQGCGCNPNILNGKIVQVAPGVTKFKVNCDCYIINNYYISRIILNRDCFDPCDCCTPCNPCTCNPCSCNSNSCNTCSGN
ncbi:MAG: hypothetical protein ACRC2K_04240 [Clostridium sp.]